MNLVFIMGKIKEKVTFKFCIHSKIISIARTKIELDNHSIVSIKGYNDIADRMYQRIQVGDKVIVKGMLDSNMEIIVQYFC